MFGDLPPSSSVIRFSVSADAAHDAPAGRRVAGERDLVDAGMLDEHLADLRARAGDDVEHAGRQADFLRDLGERERRQRRLLAGLMMTVLPHASAGATFHAVSSSGKFHGTIAPTTPTGSRSV